MRENDACRKYEIINQSDEILNRLGLLNNKEWSVKWIQLEAEEKPQMDEHGLIVYKPEYLRRNFDLNDDIKKARLYITSRGVFEAHLARSIQLTMQAAKVLGKTANVDSLPNGRM